MSLTPALSQNINYSQVELNLISNLEKLSFIVREAGHECWPYSASSLIKLRELTKEKKELLDFQVRTVLQIASAIPVKEILNNHYPEQGWVEQALTMYDLELRDDYWSQLKRDDVVEVYSVQNLQLFRTFNFFKISSYSLLDLLTNEWYHLWERPSFVLESLMKVAQSTFEGQLPGVNKMKIPRHVVKEIYYDESINYKCSSVLLEPGYICPLYGKGTSEVKGVLFSFRGQVLGRDSEANKIAMI